MSRRIMRAPSAMGHDGRGRPGHLPECAAWLEAAVLRRAPMRVTPMEPNATTASRMPTMVAPVVARSSRYPLQSSVLDSTVVSSHRVLSPTLTCLRPVVSDASPSTFVSPVWSPNWSVTGHSTSGVPVTLTRSVCLPPCSTPLRVPVMMVDSPGLANLPPERFFLFYVYDPVPE